MWEERSLQCTANRHYHSLEPYNITCLAALHCSQRVESCNACDINWKIHTYIHTYILSVPENKFCVKTTINN